MHRPEDAKRRAIFINLHRRSSSKTLFFVLLSKEETLRSGATKTAPAITSDANRCGKNRDRIPPLCSPNTLLVHNSSRKITA